jgi:DNA modification methylase
MGKQSTNHDALQKVAAIRIERKHLDDLNPAEYNPRKRLKPGDEEYEKLKRSIDTFTYVDPIIINADGTVIGGHQRLFVLRDLGYTEADVSVVNLSKADEKALNVALNKIAGDWDEEKLAELFAELDAEGYDLSLTGFGEDELSGLLSGEDADFVDMDKADEDIPEPAAKPYSKPGDIWNLGKHRLICGDSTMRETYTSLLNEERVQLVVTDPPYNVDYEGTAGKIMNDSMDSNSFRAFLFDMYSAVASVTEDGAAAYIFHADSEGVAFREEFERAGFLLKQCLIWVKNAFVLGRQDYQWRHEPILYGWKDGAAHYFTDKRNLATVIDESGKPDPEKLSREELEELVSLMYDAVAEEPTSIIYCDKPLRNAEHPTMKPTKLIAKLIENSSRAGWIVLDPFGGSGSTLVAAEATGRKARLVELDPKFCDVIVKRYASVTDKRDITLVRNGKEVPVEDTGILN